MKNLNKDQYNNQSGGLENDPNPNSNGLFKGISTGLDQIPKHRHDGNDSPHITEGNILPNNTYGGSIPMTQGTIGTGNIITWANYIIPMPTGAKEVKFYGGALNTTASPAIHAYITGSATLSVGYQFQPGTSNSVRAGNIAQNIFQGSSALIMTNGVGGGGSAAISIIRNSSSYIAFASDASNNIYAIARVFSYTNTQMIVQTAFAPNWSLQGVWIIN